MVMRMLTGKLQYVFKPVEFKDKLGETIVIRLYDPEKDRNKLEMYVNFDPEDRCLGLPPLTREGIERWIDYLSKNGYNIVAEHKGKIVGHVAIVPFENRKDVELDIFVLRPYQNRGEGGRAKLKGSNGKNGRINRTTAVLRLLGEGVRS